MNRTDRLYAIVEELRVVAPRPRSASWLANRFEVSVRTVERDISALQQCGTPIYAEPGRLGGYCLDKARTLPPVNLTPEQRELLEKFEATFSGEGARRHSPKSSTFLDGVKGFWDRMTS